MTEIDPRKFAGLVDAGFTAPDIAGHTEGWRAWRVARKVPRFGAAPKLYSVTREWYFWAPRVKARAECDRCADPEQNSPKHIPGKGCHCGFYSAKTLEHLREMDHYISYQDDGRINIIGQVANWGKVIEGSQGWRAEFAYPVVLYVPHEAWRLATPLENGYGVRVKLLNLLREDAMPEEAI